MRVGHRSDPPGTSSRRIERVGGTMHALAPSSWPDARVEAWLDWAEAEGLTAGQAEPDLCEMLRVHAGRLSLVGRRTGLFDEAAADGFRRTLVAGVLDGALALAPTADGRKAAPTFDLRGDPGRAGLRGWLEAWRARKAAAAGGAALEARLRAVAAAVRACEGGADACADPRRNPRLARAARAARHAGADDATILDIIALAHEPAPVSGPAMSALEEEPGCAVIAAMDDADAVRAGWETGAVMVTPAAGGAAGGVQAAVNLYRFVGEAGYDHEGLAAAVRVAGTALALQGEPPASLGVVGLHETLIAGGLAYASPEGRSQAAALCALVATTAAEIAAGIAQSPRGGVADRLAVLDLAPSAGLRLQAGALSSGLEPYPGPCTWDETSDGEAAAALAPCVVRGLGVLGADLAAARAHALGSRDLESAPGVNRASLLAAGFTDLEVAAVQDALAGARTLAQAASPQVVGEGFVHDVLGAADASRADVLAVAGFDAATIRAAELYLLGAGGLADAPGLETPQVFAGAAELDLSARIAMTAACAPFAGASPVVEVLLPASATLGEARAAQVAAFAAGAPAVRLVRLAQTATLELPDEPPPPRGAAPAAASGRRADRGARPHPPPPARPAQGLYPEGGGGRPQGLPAHRRVRRWRTG